MFCVLSIAALSWPVTIELALLGAIAVGVWWLALRASELTRLRERLDALEPIQAAIEELRGESSEIELRRIEHALLDIRDDQRKVVGAMLHVAEVGARSATSSDPAVAGSAPVGADTAEERVLNRLLALGYERIEIVRGAHEGTDAEKGEEADETEENTFELRVEARRQGVLHKGKVRLRDGRIHDVTMNPSYSLFP